MNPAAAAIVLRERSSLELVDLSLRFVRALAPLSYARISAVVLAPLFGVCLVARYVADIGWGWVWLLAWAGATMAQAPFTLLAGRLLFADNVSTRSILVDTLSRSFVSGLLLILRTLLFVVSAVTFVGPLIVWVHTAYLHEILYLESASLRTALRRTRRFVSGRTGSSIEMLFLSTCVLVAFVVIGEVLGLVLVSYVLEIGIPTDVFIEDGGSIFALAGFLAAVPFTSTLRFLFYVNERTLRDGWDVQVRFLGIRDGLQRIG